uniref:Uncharacterized protein n=1 Tax=Magnetospirillum gryphiswaldense TaxID=55518 RepID=A4TYR7_9PROT|nr:conserved hypothetical protein [Magnetospirillum gryphiswaldense MSR-1]
MKRTDSTRTLTRAMYVAVCKDTDEIYVERIPADRAVGETLVAIAGRVINAARPPERLSADPAWWQCRWCEHHPLCHEAGAAERNCRTCLHSTPVEGGWHCARHDRGLSSADQRRGCELHLYIPDLVPGEPMDAGDDHVVYRMKTGATWIDGRAPC